MKKILFSLSVIGVVGIFTIGATFANFSASKTSESNTFSVGGLSILLAGKNNAENEVTAPNAFFNVQNMVPGGDCEKAYIEIKNDGDMDMLFRVYGRNASGDTSLLDYLDVTATLRPDGYSAVLTGDPYGPNEPKFTWEGTLREIYGVEKALDNEDAAFAGWPLNPDYVAVYEIEVCLSFDTPNTLQGASMTADLSVDATQFDGQEEGQVKW